jgi:acetolactate synthase-1/2/3 large subunit
VKDVKDIAPTMKKAFYIAATGRPGPVVDIPRTSRAHRGSSPGGDPMRSYNPVVKGHAGQIKKAIQTTAGP